MKLALDICTSTALLLYKDILANFILGLYLLNKDPVLYKLHLYYRSFPLFSFVVFLFSLVSMIMYVLEIKISSFGACY